MKPAVFFERDGVLNEAWVERHHQVGPLTLDEFKIHVEAASTLNQLREAGYVLIATTNQPGLSQGYQSRVLLERMHQMLRAQLQIDDVFVCPHDETDRCPCRKPREGLLLEAAYKWRLDLDRSFVVSDKWQDAQAARAAGCTSLLIQSPWIGTVHRDFLVADLGTAVEKILALRNADAALAF
ncbi:MAG TPA: HAD-IIIA family hydrolase [Clostridia bacterium]|nr:HAD-IIIA family hydrolase [Clostridia bacterium]